MKHGNQKYDFAPLKTIGGEVTVKPANLYSLKSAIRQALGLKKENLEYKDLPNGQYKVTRTA